MSWITNLIPGFKTYLGAFITFLGALLAFLQYLNGTPVEGSGSFTELWKALLAAGIAIGMAGIKSSMVKSEEKQEARFTQMTQMAQGTYVPPK